MTSSAINHTHGKFIGLRLLVEGIELPIISMSVVGGHESPSRVTFELPVADSAMSLPARALAHVFFWDSDAHLREYAQRQYEDVGGEDKTGYPTVSEDMRSPGRWKLLFVGEIMAIGGSGTINGQQFTAQCADLSTYWEACPLYFGSGDLSGSQGKQVMFMGGVTLKQGKTRLGINADADSPYGSLISVMKSAPRTYPTLTGPLGAAISLMETVCGVYEAANGKDLRGVSDFLSQAEMRLRLSRLVMASPEDTTSGNFLDSAEFSRLVSRFLRSQSSLATYKDLLSLILSTSRNSFTSVLCPPYFQATKEWPVEVLVPVGAGKESGPLKELFEFVDNYDKITDDRYKTIAARLSDSSDELREKYGAVGLYGPTEFSAAGPVYVEEEGLDPQTFNKHDASLFYSFIDTTAEAAPDAKLPYVVMYDNKGVDKPRAEIVEKDVTNARLVRIAETVDVSSDEFRKRYTDETGSAIVDVVTELLGATQQTDNWVRANYTQTHASVIDVWRTVQGVKDKLKRVRRHSAYKRVKKKIPVNNRLGCFLIAPDLFMVPPPKCNVLFPSDYMSFSHSRSFLNEITRLWLNSTRSTENDPEASNRRYFAPNTDIVGGPGSKEAALAASNAQSFLLPSEIFTGVIPAIETVSDDHIFAKINKSSNPNDADSLSKKSPHMQRAANAIFLKRRFQSRTATVNCRFNPYIVAGLPALVLDKNTEQYYAEVADRLRQEGLGQPTIDAINSMRGTHYYGLVESVQHSFHQGGASTVVTLSHVRPHTEGLDVFAAQSGKDGSVQMSSTRGRVLIPNPNKSGDTYLKGSPNSWVINTYPGISSTESGYNIASVEELLTFLGKHGLRRRKGKSYAVDVKTISDSIVANVYEISDGRKKSSVMLPFEDVARPPWFSPIYTNSRIGQDFYTQTLGCGSVVDPIAVDPLLLDLARVRNEGSEEESSELLNQFAQECTGLLTVESESLSDLRPTDRRSSPVITLSSTTCKTAAEDLAVMYGKLRGMGAANVDAFVANYKYRPMATFSDILGETNPYTLVMKKYSTDNADEPVTGDLGGGDLVYYVRNFNIDQTNITPAMRGFHGRAFGMYENLDELNNQPLFSYKDSGIAKAKERIVSGAVDSRKRKYELVLEYAKELSRTGGS